MQKKLFGLLSLLVLLSLALTACGGGAATEAPAEEPAATEEAPAATEEAPAATEAAAEEITLTLGSWRVDDVAAWEAINAAFHEKYPNITVKFDPTNPPDYNATLRTQLETGTGPDLYFVRSFATGRELFDAGYVASLKDLPGINDSFTEASRAPWATETGEPYAVPIIAVSHGVYYNKEIFAANGIEVPATWEELMAASQTLLDAGVIPFANGTKDAWDINEVVMMQFIPSNIGGFEGRMAYLNGDRCFNSEEMVASFQQIDDMQPYLPNGFEAVSYYDAAQLFAQGQAAMMMDGSWSIGAFEKDATDFEWGVFYPPALEGKDTYVTFHIDAAIGANAASPNLEAAMTFLEFLESSDFAGLLGNNLPGFFPLTKDVPTLSDPIAADFMAFNESAAGVDIRFVWEKLLAAPSGSVDAYTSLNNNVIAVLKDEKTPQEAADAFNADLAAWYEPAAGCK
ncbi:MAG: extracellular solute-binding protein [Anaerolineales bacterium]|jgi:raffinose/stachyose/melibiose transport system substrate-binding protein|nr:extracellular solute-binding protein [Anaerolineales bacterium]